MKNFETTETINKRLSAATSHRQTNSFFVGGISSSSEDPFSEPISTAHPHSNSDITSPFLQHHLQQGEGIFRGMMVSY
ncbi:unnamed protein product [Coffea canephora]|uniref:Uncharacterized protein n=1 Tax=Coffea canephora TaxID=49390 RepID=A0A068UC18_COFCA|nr:unnamed protein product [Coffea canephora]